MVKVGLVGAGKMGISHLSILGAHADVQVAGVCDTSKMVTDVLRKFSPFPCYNDFDEMLQHADADAYFVAAPTKHHANMIGKLLERGKHVFAEKPLSLSAAESEKLTKLAAVKGVINQVGYHNKFVGTFEEIKKLMDAKCIGDILHFTGESYGPVVIRAKQENWRSKPDEGGGCLMDYASHVIDLLNYVVGPIKNVRGAFLKSYYSKDVDDAVHSLIETENGVTGVLSVDWSDETYRKMSTAITINGTLGKIIGDANELKVYFKSTNCPPGYEKGWNIRHVTDLTRPVDFYLRGEEYSAQVDYFIKSIQGKVPNTINDFASASHTDKVISLIKTTANR